MATNGYYGPPGGFDLAALKVREAALTPDGARAESPKVYVSPDAPGRVANVFRRRGQWSLPWWEIETPTPAPAPEKKPRKPV